MFGFCGASLVFSAGALEKVDAGDEKVGAAENKCRPALNRCGIDEKFSKAAVVGCEADEKLSKAGAGRCGFDENLSSAAPNKCGAGVPSTDAVEMRHRRRLPPAIAVNSADQIDVCIARPAGQTLLRSDPPHARNRWPSMGHRSPHPLTKILSPAQSPKSAKRTNHQQHDTNKTGIPESELQTKPRNASVKAKPRNTSAKTKPRPLAAHHQPSAHPQKWAVTNPEPHVTAPSQPLSTLEKGMDTNTARSENASI